MMLRQRAYCVQESKRNVIELHDDDPTALETTIRWLYTGNLHSDNPNLTWQPSIEVLITADKYSLTDLSLQVLTHLELRDCFTFVSPSHLQHAVSRAADFSDTGGRMQKILFDICDKHFRECFDDAAFRDWLETMPWLRDRLYKRHIAWLARHTAFRAKLRKGGEFALDVVDCLLELLQRPAERGRFGSEPLRVRAVRPRPRDARHPYLPTFAG